AFPAEIFLSYRTVSTIRCPTYERPDGHPHQKKAPYARSRFRPLSSQSHRSLPEKHLRPQAARKGATAHNESLPTPGPAIAFPASTAGSCHRLHRSYLPLCPPHPTILKPASPP